MKAKRQSLGHQGSLWKRIWARHGLQRCWIRRVPLVFFRSRAARIPQAGSHRKHPNVFQFPLNIQIHLNWPLSKPARTKLSVPQFNLYHSNIYGTEEANYGPTRIQHASAGRTQSTLFSRTTHESRPERAPSGAAVLGAIGSQPRGLQKERRANVSTTHRSFLQEPVDEPTVDPTGVRNLSESNGKQTNGKHNTSAPQPSPRVLWTNLITRSFLRTARSRNVIEAPFLEQLISKFAVINRKIVANETLRHSRPAGDVSPAVVRETQFLSPADLQPRLFGKGHRTSEEFFGAVKQRSFVSPVARDLLSEPSSPANRAAQEHITSRPQPATPVAAPAPLDIARLSDEVYRQIQRKIRIERERRGL